MKFKIVPYGKWWQHLLKGNLYMVYRALFGWKRKGAYSSPLILNNFGVQFNMRDKDNGQTEFP